MTFDNMLQQWQPIPGAQQAQYYKRKKPEFVVRIAPPPPPKYVKSVEKDTHVSSSDDDEVVQTSTSHSLSQPSSLEIQESLKNKNLRRPWESAKEFAMFNSKCHVYSLDIDGNFFDIRKLNGQDPYQNKKQDVDTILVTSGIVHTCNDISEEMKASHQRFLNHRKRLEEELEQRKIWGDRPWELQNYKSPA